MKITRRSTWKKFGEEIYREERVITSSDKKSSCQVHCVAIFQDIVEPERIMGLLKFFYMFTIYGSLKFHYFF